MIVNSEGEIFVGSVSAESLALQYGTPLYAYDAERIRENYRRVSSAFTGKLDRFSIHYAVKACNNLSIAGLLAKEGAGADVASPNEIRLAQMLDMPMKRVIFTGNNLADADLQFALSAGVTINLDDHTYLERLLVFGRPEILSFRINPGNSESRYASNSIGAFAGAQSKFGLHVSEVASAYERARDAGIRHFGAHMMAGSCVLDYHYFPSIVNRLLDVMAPITKDLGISLDFIDIGGGLGIPYDHSLSPLNIENVAAGVAQALKSKCKHHNIPLPRLIMEPARYLVGDAGVLIGRILSKKDKYKVIYGTDISMCTFARTVMYDSHHQIYINGRRSEPSDPVCICGQVCENTDVWEEQAKLPSDTSIGDLIVVGDAGAYGYSMSYQYNGRLRPAEILVDGTQHYEIRRRETFEDMIRGMVPPAAG